MDRIGSTNLPAQNNSPSFRFASQRSGEKKTEASRKWRVEKNRLRRFNDRIPIGDRAIQFRFRRVQYRFDIAATATNIRRYPIGLFGFSSVGSLFCLLFRACQIKIHHPPTRFAFPYFHLFFFHFPRDTDFWLVCFFKSFVAGNNSPCFLNLKIGSEKFLNQFHASSVSSNISWKRL